MVTPDRRRVAVQRVQQRFGVSERRACAVLGQHRSTQRRAKAPTDDAEARLREHLRDFARCHPRLGWRKAHVVAHREGLVTNPKRTRRVWRDERLQRPPQRRRLADGTAARLRAQRPNDVWALDFQFDETADLRRVKLLNIVDEFTREALCVEAAHSIAADGVVAAVERLIAQRGAPAHLRMDNGPELVSAALRDWCRIWGTHTAHIEPGSPWENPYIESFNGRLRDECLNTEDFADLLEARVVLEDWRTEYNMPTGHTNPSAGSPPPPTLTTGHTNTNQHTHSTRTHNRVPLTTACCSSRPRPAAQLHKTTSMNSRAVACDRPANPGRAGPLLGPSCEPTPDTHQQADAGAGPTRGQHRPRTGQTTD